MCKLVSDLLPQQSIVIFALTSVVPFLINMHESYFHLLQECFHVSLYTFFFKKKTTVMQPRQSLNSFYMAGDALDLLILLATSPKC